MAHWKEMENSWEVCIAYKNPYGPGQNSLNFDSQSRTATWTKKQTKNTAARCPITKHVMLEKGPGCGHAINYPNQQGYSMM